MMDLVATVYYLCEAVETLSRLAKEQAGIIEQNRLAEEETIRDFRRRRREVNEKLTSLGVQAQRDTEEGR